MFNSRERKGSFDHAKPDLASEDIFPPLPPLQHYKPIPRGSRYPLLDDQPPSEIVMGLSTGSYASNPYPPHSIATPPNPTLQIAQSSGGISHQPTKDQYLSPLHFTQGNSPAPPTILQPPRIHVNAGDHLELDTLDAPTQDVLPYKVLGNLGHGGSASVEKIEDIHTGKTYARKIMRGVYARNIKAVKQEVQNEVKIMKRLSAHHHMVKLHATYISKRELAIILDPVADEGDLASFLEEYKDKENHKTFGNPQVDVLLRCFGCLASGLAFMHRHTIRHKDIKPQNILIHRGQVLYTDFGLSYDFADVGQSTTVGFVHGMTRRYCAPEVAKGGSRNSKSDIFSLGCVYFEIMAALYSASVVEDVLQGPFHEKLEFYSDTHRSIWDLPLFDSGLSITINNMLKLSSEARPSATQVIRHVKELTYTDFYFCFKCLQEISNNTMPLQEA